MEMHLGRFYWLYGTMAKLNVQVGNDTGMTNVV